MIVDRKEFAARDNLEVSPHVRDLQIDYTSPTFSIPQKVKFRYKLDGYDDDWHEAGSRRQAFYTDLPPRTVHVPGDGGQQRRRLERARRHTAVLHRSGVLPDDLVSRSSPPFRSWRSCGRRTGIGCAVCNTRLR